MLRLLPEKGGFYFQNRESIDQSKTSLTVGDQGRLAGRCLPNLKPHDTSLAGGGGGWGGDMGQSGAIWCYREALGRFNGAGVWSSAQLMFQTMKLPEASALLTYLRVVGMVTDI